MAPPKMRPVGLLLIAMAMATVSGLTSMRRFFPTPSTNFHRHGTRRVAPIMATESDNVWYAGEAPRRAIIAGNVSSNQLVRLPSVLINELGPSFSSTYSTYPTESVNCHRPVEIEPGHSEGRGVTPLGPGSQRPSVSCN